MAAEKLLAMLWQGKTPMWKSFIATALVCTSMAVAQTNSGYSSSSAIRSRTQSRAEVEAEERVSLSPETILQTLQQEPGLLLQVKKILVRKAYEQGRLLDPADLTDAAVFRLVSDDENVRILATQEIEKRFYIRPKPTREEMEQDQLMSAQTGLSQSAPMSGNPANTPQATSNNQEDAYWQRYQMLQNYSAPKQFPAPGQPSIQQMPQLPVPPTTQENPARTVQRTSAQPDMDNPSPLDPNAAGGMQRISPDELSQLLAANSTPGPLGLTPASQRDSSFPGTDALSRYSQMPRLTPDLPDELPESNQQANATRPRIPFAGGTDFNQERLIRHRANPYANVPSLYDLYAQASGRPPVLQRFGMDIFRNGTGNFDQLPMDLPAGPENVSVPATV